MANKYVEEKVELAGKYVDSKVEVEEPEVTDEIFTVSNIITFIRLCMVPLFLVLLIAGLTVPSTIVFATAACTDFVDGQIARRTNTVSKLGQLLDPAVDRLLMIFGVLGLLLVGRLPLWVVVFVVVRDLYLLVGGAILLKRWQIRVPVVYAGKFATTFLFIGFGGLLLNHPLYQGVGITNASWLPGLNHAMSSWGIWFVYAGIFLSFFTAIYYTIMAFAGISRTKKARAEEGVSA